MPLSDQVIEALSGVVVTKLTCGSQFSMALTAIAQVYTWGSGPCLGQVTSLLAGYHPLLWHHV